MAGVRDETLYLGINTSGVTSHVSYLQGWCRPAPPDGFPDLVAVLRPVPGKVGMRWDLDFLDAAAGRYASEVQELSIPWPWIDGFTPLDGDWAEIGIPAQW